MKKEQPESPGTFRKIGLGGAVAVALAALAGIGVSVLASDSGPVPAGGNKLAADRPAPAAAAPVALASPAAAPAAAAPFPAMSMPGMLQAALPATPADQSNARAQAEAARKARLAEYEKIEMAADFVPASADGSTDNPPFARIRLPEFSNGGQAIALLGKDLPAVAAWYGMSADALSHLLLTDNSVHLDRKGRIVHIDEGVPGTAAGSTATAATVSASTAPYPLDQTFKLHTKPDSTRVLFLDFNGQGQYPAFSLDGTPATFSDAERLLIQKAWLRVAEDYAAFDVDVTTEAPAVPSGKIGATVLITPQSSTAGGYAYLNSFTRFAPGAATAFCFPNNLANSEKPIGECISHELGHTLGLQHQGTAGSAYYGGQGDGLTGWAPIMGVSYYKNLSQWAKGEYKGATNKEDAYAVMSRQGLKPRTDDHGNSIALASALTSVSANGYANLSGSGVIESPLDTDMFGFAAGAGQLTLKVAAASLGADLDVALQLFDASGKLLASGNPATELDAGISVLLAQPGMYYLSVKGSGKGDPLTTGYSNYGSIGRYSISGTAALTSYAAAAAPVVVVVKASSSVGTGTPAVKFDGSASTAAGATKGRP